MCRDRNVVIMRKSKSGSEKTGMFPDSTKTDPPLKTEEISFGILRLMKYYHVGLSMIILQGMLFLRILVAFFLCFVIEKVII